MSEPNWKNRTLFHGDNLDFLRAMNSESVDLIATDPPFNKGRDFHATPDSLASGAKFQDRWSWERDVHEEWVEQIKDDYPRLLEAIESAKHAHSDGMGAFMCFMAVRLLAMRRVLKPTGSIYLHCDPTASHYLKAVMDAIFGWQNFRNEVIWKRSANPKGSQHEMGRFSPFTDTILYYGRSEVAKIDLDSIRIPLTPEELTKKYPYEDERGRYADGPILRSQGMGVRPNLVYTYKGFTPGPAGWRVKRDTLEEIDKKGNLAWTRTGGVRRKLRPSDIERGRPVGSLWDDIPPINSQALERTGYPTQKPLAIYERIIKASSNEGDMVLDPFCGCATTLIAAERLKRQWVGIDIWEQAHDTVIRRLSKEGLSVPDGSVGEALPLYGEICYSKEPPERTDTGETAVVALETINRRELAAWQKLSHKDMVAILKEAQADADNAKLVICAGCGRKLEPEFMELDHMMPKSEPHSTNDLSNRILLCRPCNGRKSNRLTMNGLWRENKNKEVGWMVDENLAKNAVVSASNAVLREQRKD